MKFVLFWMVSTIFCLFFFRSSDFAEIGLILPLLFCFITIIISNLSPSENFRTKLVYLLFFSTSLLTFFGILKPLTGSVSESHNAVLFGFSFYTLSLAYLLKNSNTENLITTFKISNPTLLATGPIAIFVTNYSYRKLHFRVNYFLPFVIVGFFFFHIIGLPLIPLFTLIHATDSVSAILFAVTFELFLYANFCGLSLILYGFFGIAGYRIPLNFKQPFSSNNIIDFWRGWHLSLTTILKSLFYSPLRQKFPPSVAILGVFLASAMWHGMTLNFFIWGCFHAVIFISTIFLLKNNIRFLPTILLIFAFILGRIIFAEKDIELLMQKLLFPYEGLIAFETIWSQPITSKASLIIGFSLVAIEFFFRKTKMLKKRNYKHLRTPFSLIIMLTITIFLINQGGPNFAVYGQR